MVFSQNNNFDFDGINFAKNMFSSNFGIENIKNSPSFELCFKKPYQIDEKGDIVEVFPEKTEIKNGMKINYYIQRPSSKIRWSIWCKGNQPTWAIKETYQYDVKSAGHNHDGNIPKLKVTNTYLTPNEPSLSEFKEKDYTFYLPESGSLYNNTTYYYWELMPDFAVTITEDTQFLGSCSGLHKDIIYVMVKGLVELSTGTGYSLVGQTIIHPKNHFGLPSFLEQLKVIGKKWKEEICPKSDPLYYNDISLPWGGLFDLNGDWKPPHTTHREGKESDLNKRTIKIGDREKLIQLMCNYVKVYNEGEKEYESPHYHLVDKNTKGDFLEYLSQKYTYCCTNPIPDTCIKLYDHGTLIPENNEQLCP